MSPRAIETPSASRLYIPPHLRAQAPSRTSSQSSMTAPETSEDVAVTPDMQDSSNQTIPPPPPPANVDESVAIQATSDMQDNSTQIIPIPPEIIVGSLLPNPPIISSTDISIS